MHFHMLVKMFLAIAEFHDHDLDKINSIINLFYDTRQSIILYVPEYQPCRTFWKYGWGYFGNFRDPSGFHMAC